MVIETTTFRLADGVDNETFLEFDEAVRTGFLYHQPGMVRATTARGEGTWIVIVMWESEAAADAALAAGTNDGTMQRFTELVDGAVRNRYSTID